MLASYAVEHSRGRRHPEPTHPYRNDFQRDRDRVIHSRAFRRLEAKTQVFTRRYSDHFRNRLTHTLEVAQISRTIAAQLGLNVDLVEALALVHDIGHPPFGHAGERALDTAVGKYGFSFDHNLHALRIVEDFELRYAAFPGLNLTFEVREGIIKHSRDYSASEFPELSEYLLDQRPPLEAQLIDITDELAYNTADLDDGYEAKLLTLEQIIEGVPLFEQLFPEIEQRYPHAPKKLQFNEVLRRMLDRWVGDLIENTRAQVAAINTSKAAERRENTARGVSPGSAEHQNPAAEGRQNANAGAPATPSLDDIRACPRRLAGLSPEIEAERRQTKQFLHRNLYFTQALEPEKEAAERIITDLFELWMAHPEKLPGNYREKAQSEPLARVVCDYIAGMTDPYIYEQYEKHCG
jgi:dGTPase